MSLLDERFTRRGSSAPTHRHFSLRLPALFFVSFALMALSRLGHPAIKELRAEAEALIAPALSVLALPLEPAKRLVRQVQSSYDGFSELERLKIENQRLKQWESRAHELERKVGELATLTRALEQQPLDYRTVRVIATSSGAFQQSALLEAGTDHGIKIGQPVLSAGGVLGRIVEAGRRSSRVLLLNDPNSRVPVVIGPSQIRAVMAGDNGAAPRLTQVSPGTVIDSGDEVLTSGVGGMFPRGLLIGRVRESERGYVVALDAALGDLEYVSILLYDNPGTALAAELKPAPAAGNGRRRSGADSGSAP